MRAVRSSVLLALLACTPFGVAACGGGDASPPPSDGTGGAPGGAGGRDASAGGGGGSEHDASLPDAKAPTGPRTIRLLHGVTDAPWLAFCFAKVEGGVEGPLAPERIPRGGLRYGGSVVVSELPGGARFGSDSVRPYVVAASSEEAVAGLDCAAIAALTGAPPVDAGVPDASVTDAGAPHAGVDAGDAGDGGPVDAGPPPPIPIAAVRMAALPVLPARAFFPEESYLVALAGCLGGRGVTAIGEASICGVGYSPSTPTLAANVVRLSRETLPRAVGLQFLVATPTFGRADLRLVPSLSGDPITVAKGVGTGALRPVTPYLDAAASDIGAGAIGARVQVTANGSAIAAYDQPWQPTLEAGGLETLADGRSYTLVLLGPTPSFGAGRWWNDALVTIVPNGE